MRVLQVSSGLSTGGRGGAERFCLELSDWLCSSGAQVGLAGAIEDISDERFQRWPLREARRKLFRKLLFDYVSPGNAEQLRQVIATFAPDVVHVHNIYGLSSQLVRVAADLRPTIVTLHDYWPIDVFVPRLEEGRLRYPARNTVLAPWVLLHRRLHRRNLRGATLVAPSRYLASRMERCGYRTVRVIRNGVSLPSDATTRELLLLFVGRLVSEKGLQTVLAAAEDLAKKAGWRIEVVGDGPLRGELERRFPDVRFVGRTDPQPFYRRASVVVVPSLWPENLPYVILEAMSYSVTVLASEVGGVPELIENGSTGLLFESGNAESFAAALRSIISNPEAQRRLGQAARERIEAEFGWNVAGPQYLTLYEELLDGSRSASDAAKRTSKTPIRGRAG